MPDQIVLLLFTIVAALPPLSAAFFSIPNISNIQVKSRLAYFDALRGLAIIAVVFIHVRRAYQLYGLENDLSFLFSINNASRFAIGFFLLCSGILLNPHVRNWAQFYWRKLIRIFIPYILASGIIMYASGSFEGLVTTLLTGSASVPYYFMVILLQCYLVYPLLVLCKNYKKELLVVSFFISLASLMMPSTWFYNSIPLATKYLFFFVYGSVKRDLFLQGTLPKKDLYAWIGIILAFTVLNALHLELLYNVRLFYAIALFHILFYIKPFIQKTSILLHGLAWIGRYSLWIYLIHYGIVLLAYTTIFNISDAYYINFFLISVISCIGSCILAWILGWSYKQFEDVLIKKSS